MNTAGIISLVVAIIGVAGALWAQVVQFKKDSGKMNDIKADTGEMKPSVKNIDENVKIIQSDVIRRLIPKVDGIAGIGADTKVLIDELNYQKRLKEELSVKALNKDYFVNGINELYEENARLAAKLKAQVFVNQKLQMENAALKNENQDLKNELRNISPQQYEDLERE